MVAIVKLLFPGLVHISLCYLSHGKEQSKDNCTSDIILALSLWYKWYKHANYKKSKICCFPSLSKNCNCLPT